MLAAAGSISSTKRSTDALISRNDAATVKAAREIGGRVDITFSTPDDGLNVYESKWGEPIVWVYEYRMGTVINQERYESDKAFAQAYGIQSDD